jgi:hypothetical protein
MAIGQFFHLYPTLEAVGNQRQTSAGVSVQTPEFCSRSMQVSEFSILWRLVQVFFPVEEVNVHV